MSFPRLKNKLRGHVSGEINHFSYIGKSPGNLLWHRNVAAHSVFMLSSSNPWLVGKYFQAIAGGDKTPERNLDGEQVGSTGSGAEEREEGCSSQQSTQPCKASRRTFAWLEKWNYEGRRQWNKGNHHEIQSGRPRASHLHQTGCFVQVPPARWVCAIEAATTN